jgi:hypothetical protein
MSIEAGLAQITVGRVTGTISFLASDELAGRAIGTPEFNIASAYVAARFRGAGLVGCVPAPVVEGSEAGDNSFYQDALIENGKALRNVIGLLRGSDPSLAQEAVLFSAHLDHLPARPEVGDGIFNGADDDASGVTAVVMLADAFGAWSKPKRSILFVAFGGEESGLLGSKHFANEPLWPLDKIVANINIEMIGRPEPGANGKMWMTGWQKSDLGTLLSEVSSRKNFEIFEHPKFSTMLYQASDNWSLAKRGVVAHSFSAGSLHGDYHQPDDEWERLEIPHLTRVIQGLFEASQPLVQGRITPKSKEKIAN